MKDALNIFNYECIVYNVLFIDYNYNSNILH